MRPDRFGVTLFAIASFALAVAPRTDLEAQVPGAALQRGRFEIGVDGGLTGNAADAFSDDQICPSSLAYSLGLRGRAALGRWLGVEATGQLFFPDPGPRCVDGLIPPPPPQGPFTLRYAFFDSRMVGYPFAPTSVRLQLVPLASPNAELRTYVGIGRVWSKRVTLPQAGASLLLGRRSVRFLMEADLWWYRVPQHQITEDYQDGQLVARRDDIVRLHEWTIVVRAGATFPLHRPAQ
jgi:hypothetical protein